eukprot:8625718-Pyramimonas_sp.AAC.1
MTRGARPTRRPSQSPPRSCSRALERTSSPSQSPHVLRYEGAVSRRALEPHLFFKLQGGARARASGGPSCGALPPPLAE